MLPNMRIIRVWLGVLLEAFPLVHCHHFRVSVAVRAVISKVCLIVVTPHREV